MLKHQSSPLLGLLFSGAAWSDKISCRNNPATPQTFRLPNL
jgi:hypothetical protein